MHCLASGCTENHNTHQCYLCGNNNSNHISANCSNRYNCFLYHGTRIYSLFPITMNGILPSSSGRLGPGVYLSTLDSARTIAHHRNNGQAVVVLKFRCNLGSVKTYQTGVDNNSGDWIREGYQSAHGMHPPWANINHYFREWVVKDVSQIQLVAIELVDGVYNGSINVPGVDIYISGTVTFGGNITAGNLNIGGRLNH
jgi:hypothetical protein